MHRSWLYSFYAETMEIEH